MCAEKAFALELEDSGQFQRLLAGKPQTCGMKAGRVQLQPGGEVGEHNTGEREELLVFLSGSGQALVGDEKTLDVGEGKICYVPPNTLHNIKNNGAEPLVYIYCVSMAG
ncbi:MAG: cupin domain-containing protein [Planctomycetota bacterium]